MSNENATTMAAMAATLDVNQTGEVSLYELLKVVPNTEMDVVSGYVSTAVVLFTVVTNCIVCVVLLKPHMRTSPTNIILVALSITTTLTGVWPLPCNVYFYVLGGYVDWVPAGWCFAFECLNDYLPTIFHTASIWLTVLLAVQRYVSVCHSGTAAARRFRTVDNALRAIVGVMLAAVMSHAFRFAERRFTAVAVPSMSGDGRTVSACVDELVPFVYYNQHVYYSVYYVFRVVFVNVLPCTVLVLLNAALVHTMRAAETRRKALLKHHRRSESRRLAESNSTTLMLIVVVGVFLLVEFPMAVIFVTLIFSNVLGLNVFDPSSSSMASSIVNLCILFSYLFNFFIYCAMSRQFRETFCRLFVQRQASPDRGSRVISLHGTSTHGGALAEVGYSQVPETDQRETV